MSHLSPTLIPQTAQRLQGIINKTPVMTSRTLNERVGCEVFLKCENFQRVGAFKFRGAYNAISQLSPTQKAAGVIAHSSGNHAQGLALAASLLGVKAVVVMPEDSPAIKRAATAGYGAEIVTCPAIQREQVVAELVSQHGYTLIHPYDNDHIIAGQGTAAWELFEEVGPLDVLFTPVGGGGLISGCALATAVSAPGCRVVGVEPQTGDDAGRSWRTGEIVKLDYVPDTIADGVRTRFIGQRNLDVMRQYVHDMTTASDEAILETLDFLWTHMKLLVEPTAALALAPLFTGSYPLAGKKVGIILSGGNADILSVANEIRDWKLRHNPPPTAPPASKERPKILVCDELDEAALAILRQAGDVTVRTDMEREEMIAEIRPFQAIIVGSSTYLAGQVIEYGDNLRVIGCASSRLDNINVSAARAMGVEVCHAPNSTAVAIADHTMRQLLTLAAKFGDGSLAGKTLGLIGFGRIAQQVAKRARAFDIRVIVNQPRLTPELALSAGAEATDLIELLRQADFVSLHVPFNPQTQAIIGATELAEMQPTACLINPGHTDLVDEVALLQALGNGRIAAAALSSFPADPTVQPRPHAIALRSHPNVITAPHVTTIIGGRQKDTDVAVAKQVAAILQSSQTKEALALELVPIELVIPHEQIDEKRVRRLMERLEEDGRLVNPPLTTYWNGKYIVLDGATRTTAFNWAGYPHLIVQVVPHDQEGFTLHTWYHAISSDKSFDHLLLHLQQIPGLVLSPLPTNKLPNVFQDPKALCYFLNRNGQATIAQANADADRLQVMNDLVTAYTAWGDVERTLLTDLPRLLAQFPKMTAVAIFPQFDPTTVFEVASRGELLPAGLTRFLIPGRILRLNADLARLKENKPLAAKRAWFNQFLEEKLARSRLRYYQEPVILLDE